MPSITLSDGTTHTLGKPSFKTLQHLDEQGASFDELKTSDLPIVVHALIKRAEPSFSLSVDELADLMDASMDAMQDYMTAVLEAFGASLPDSDDSDKPKRPTSGRAGVKKP
jgi:hypothetical protein